MISLVTGGARSGKSTFAERYAAHLAKEGIYIATSEALDDEMRERIRLHQSQRRQSGFRWTTVEEPLQLVTVLRNRGREERVKSGQTVLLVDCLTLWLSNMMLAMKRTQLEQAIDDLIRELGRFEGHVILVTNEVGDGIVPADPLARQFRDLAGWMNQRVADACDQVFLVTAGIPLELKSMAFRFPDQ